MTINEVNHRLETRPYFDIYLDYKADIILPDSVQIKMVSALKRILPQHFADSVFTMSEAVLKNIEEYAWRQCRKDTACFEKTYAERYEMNIEFNKKNYANRCYSRSFVLACGSWDIKEAIPYLKKELQDKKCEYMHVEIEMALAKLNDSIKQALIDRYTLANLLESSQLDTIDNNAPIYNLKYTWSHYNGLQTAVYFKSKEMILNILDLIYIKGISMGSIGDDEYYIPAVSDFLNCFQCFGYFHSVPNRNVLWDICDNYRSVLGSYEDKKPTKKEIKRMEKLLSTAYRTKIKEQIRDWIIENVNFE
jgi:hypothetical protein